MDDVGDILFCIGFSWLIITAMVTTPPIPSSSPCHDAMDMSPLPHKPAFSAMRAPMSPASNASMNLCSSPPSAAPTPELPRMDLPRRPGGLAEYANDFLEDSILLLT